MSIYIFPIFLFGCVITGIVFMAVQQASDWAKDEAARKVELESRYTSTERIASAPINGQPNRQPE